MSIKITPEIRRYALGVAAIGERMNKTGNEFGEVGDRLVSTVEEIKNKKEDFKRLNSEFESQEQTLLKLNAPKILREDHSKLFTSFNRYVIATEKAISSLDVENIKTDESLLKEAQNLQIEASKEIVQITNEMARKLGI